jgi:hypothetical protein
MKIAVISSSLGGFDSQPQHVEQSVKADYFYFNDENFPLRKSMTPRLQAKIPKMFGWQMASGYDYYVWLDGNIAFNHFDTLKFLMEKIAGYHVVALKHHRRKTIWKEARYLEEQLQLEYGLETDRLKLTNNSTFKSGPNNPVIKKLNDIDRVNIRLLYNTGNYTRKELSLQYNVSETTIYHIIKNKIQNL